jgi:hypothetical protein
VASQTTKSARSVPIATRITGDTFAIGIGA